MNLGKFLKLSTVILAAGVFSYAQADEWGDWDDLPDEIFGDDSGINTDDLTSELSVLIEAGDQDATMAFIQNWMSSLDDRLIADNDELSDLAEAIREGDQEEIQEEIADILEDQRDEDEFDDDFEDEFESFEDELEDELADELVDELDGDSSGSGSGGSSDDISDD